MSEQITKDLGGITAYAAAVAAGYTGTKAQFETLMASYATVAQNAAASATAANGSAEDAEAFADGQRDGVDVGSTDPAYHNNAKYYAELAEDYADSIDPDTLAKIDGYYDTLGAGTAEQLTSNIYEEDSVPYNFRTSGGSIDIGDRETDMLVGGTVTWNQLAPITSKASGTQSDVDYTNNGDGSFTLNGTCTENADVYLGVTSHFNVVADHIYLLPSGRYWTGYSSKMVFKNTYNATYFGIYLKLKNGVTYNNERVWIQAFDLTSLLGSTIAEYILSLEQANAGAGVAFFRKLFPKPYYAYNAGELMSVNASSHDMVGFNAWDEVTESGYINNSTGENVSSASQIRGKNYIHVIPNTTYYFKSPTGLFVYFYDANKEYIGVHGSGTRITNNTITLGADVHYIRISMPSDYGTTYKNDICINLSWDGERDGEYEAYVKHSYPLDDSLTLRGIPKLDANNNLYYDGDTYESDGKVTRNTILRAYQSGDESLANAITDGTNTVVYSANASTETADPYTNPQIVNDFGTEEYADYAYSQSLRDVSIPVGHYTQYMANLKAKLEMSPNSPEGAGDYIVRQTNGENEYVTLASNATIQDIIARLEALEGDTEGGGE